MEIFEKYPNVNVIVHGHCKDVTYSPKMVKYQSSEYLKYGQWGELFKIDNLFKEYQLGIMKLHGEIILASNFNEALSRYEKMYKETL